MRRAFPPVSPSTTLILIGLACAACGSAPPAPRAAAVSTPVTAPRGHALVWTLDAKDNQAATYVLADDGAVLSESPGITISASGTEWRYEASTVPLPTFPCAEGAKQPAQPGRGVRALLIPADASRAAIEVVAPSLGEGSSTNDIVQSARVLASAGPYVFVTQTTYVFTCGAHGGTNVSFAIWDIESGRPVDLLSDVADRAHLLDLGKQAIDAAPHSVDFTDPKNPPTLTEIVPRLGADGQLETHVLVTVPTCYACTRGGWGSYTASAEVPAALPPQLRALGSVPRAVGLFVQGHPSMSVGGYSVVR